MRHPSLSHPAAAETNQPSADHAARAAAVAHFGHCGLSTQVPYLAAHTWLDAEGSSLVAYVVAAGVWVAAGPPVGPAEARCAAVRGFVAAAHDAGARAALFGLDPATARAAGLRWMACGEEPVWRASAWDQRGRRPEARRQLRRAQRLGVRVELLEPGLGDTVADDAALSALLRRWEAGHALPPLGFVARATLRANEPGVVRFVARVAGEVVGLGVLLPGAPDGTYLLEQLLRAPRAPNGASEALVDAAMRYVAARAPEATVSLGIVALAGPLSWPLRLARVLARPLYPFAGLRAFRRKLQPDDVLPLGLASSPTLGAPRALAALLVAFAEGRPLRFAWRAVVAGPTPLVAAMAACLLPWTWALAHVPAGWFAGAATQRAWVAFDLLLALALVHLAWRPSLAMARTLAAVVTLDAALTALEAACTPGPDGSLALRLAVWGVAVAAPACSAGVLWGCAARLRRAEP